MGNRKQKRLSSLLDLITARPSMHIRDAAEELGVSEMTIRRDIHANPEKFDSLGGYIVPTEQLSNRTPYDLGLAADVHVKEKQLACQHCLPYITNEKMIFVDCGTTLVHLVDLLPSEQEITIVCHALNVADRAVRKPNVKLILMGGEYHPPTASFHGLGTESMFQSLGISTGFFSAAGIHDELGASCPYFSKACVKQAAMACTARRILVADSSKIGKVQLARYAGINEFDLVLTEHGIHEFQAETT